MKTLPLFLLFAFPSFAATIIPFERDISRVQKFSFSASSNATSSYFMDMFVGDEQETKYFQGYSMQNQGPNVVVTTTPADFNYAYRHFSFVTTDHSRRDNYLWITDYNGSGSISDLYETMLVFLPRENQMHVEENGDNLLVTLNTGEEVVFSKEQIMLTGGVLEEKPLDLNPDRTKRKFAQLSYHGKGLMIRSDARGADPRLAKVVQVTRKGHKSCTVAASEFWTQEGFPKFKYVTDEEAYEVIKQKCGQKFLDE